MRTTTIAESGQDGTERITDKDATTIVSDHNDDDDVNIDEIRKILSRRQPIHSTEEDPLDPIEWTVRKLIPIPETYFWEYEPPVSSSSLQHGGDESSSPTTTSTSTTTSKEWQRRLPWHLKAWHRTIGVADAAIQWTDRWVAQPVANATGLTAPYMSYVTDHMTAEEWEEARQRLRAQKRHVIQNDDSKANVIVATEEGIPVKDGVLEVESETIPIDER